LTFTTGHGARFPTVAAGQVLYCCILNANNILEEVKITAHTAGSDSATIVRAAGGTSAKVWTAGDLIQARASSEMLRRAQEEALKTVVITTADAGATYTGAMDVAALGYIKGVIYPMAATTSNSGTAPTIALDSLSAITVKLDGGGALTVGQMPVNGLYMYDDTNFILLNPLFAVISKVTNSLSGDVSLSNTGSYFTGPTVAQGTAGTWFASGTVTLIDSSGATFNVKLWDGTTVIASTAVAAGTGAVSVSLSGYLATPAGNIRISVNDASSTGGLIKFNSSGNSADSTLSAIRIA
jgi:hypothetical protein